MANAFGFIGLAILVIAIAAAAIAAVYVCGLFIASYFGAFGVVGATIAAGLVGFMSLPIVFK